MKRQISQEQYDQLPDWAKDDYEIEPEKWMPDIVAESGGFIDTRGKFLSFKYRSKWYIEEIALLGNGYTAKEKAEQAESILRPIRRVVQFLVENDVEFEIDIENALHKYWSAPVVDDALNLLEKGEL